MRIIRGLSTGIESHAPQQAPLPAFGAVAHGRIVFLLAFCAVACATAEDENLPEPDAPTDQAVDGIIDPAMDADANGIQDPAVEAEADVPDDIPADPDIDTPADPDIDTPADPDIDTPADPDIDTPADPDIDTPVDPDIDTPMDPDIDTPVDPAPDLDAVDAPDETPVSPGDTCDTAIDLSSLAVWSGSFSDYGNGWSGGWSCMSAYGRDIWFTAVVRDGHRFTMEEVTSTDVVIHRLDSCTASDCEWSSDEPEKFDFFNDTGGDVSLLFVVEAYWSSTTGSLQLDISNDVPPAGFDCRSPVDLTSTTTWTGSYEDYADLWDGGSGCMYASGAEAWFTAEVQPGHRFIMEQTSTTDVVIHRLDSCTSTVCSWSGDEPERFEYFNDTGSAVTLLFAVERYYSGSTGSLQLEITNSAPAEGFSCDAPVDVTSLTSWSGSYTDYADLWDGGSGCMYASGAEVWFTAVVQPGHCFFLEQTSTTDVVIHRVDSCSSTDCSYSSDTPEEIGLYNDTGGTVTLLLVVERYYSGSTGSIQVEVSNGPPPEGYTCEDAVDATSLSSWSGNFSDYADLWDGGSGCLYASGPEIWFTAVVAAGDTFTLENTSWTDVVLHRVGGCGESTCSWSSDYTEHFSYTNTSGAPETVFLIVEKYSGSTGDVTLDITNGP
jgi:hypothetical protein